MIWTVDERSQSHATARRREGWVTTQTRDAGFVGGVECPQMMVRSWLISEYIAKRTQSTTGTLGSTVTTATSDENDDANPSGQKRSENRSDQSPKVKLKAKLHAAPES
ncbi:MAG: hypothetical protein AAF745_15565 [Planctomycetota bacterium]